MRLVIDARTSQRQRGGIGRMVEELAEALARTAPDLEILLVCGRRGTRVAAVDGDRVREIRTSGGTVDPRFEEQELPRILEQARADVYHGTCFSLPPCRLECRTVVTIHDACARRHPEFLRPELAERLDQMTENSLARADRVATVSEFSRREMSLAYGIAAERVRVIPNAAPSRVGSKPSPPEEAEEALRRLGISRPFWLFVGAWEERKGLPELLEGYARHQSRSRRSPWPLVLVGPRGGGVRLDPRRHGEALGIEPNLRALGFVTEPDLGVLYRSAVALIHLSRYEGFGLPALEALSLGLPTLAARAGASEEVLGDAALYVPSRDPEAVASAMDQIQGDLPLRLELARRGPLRANCFSWDEAARAYLELYGLRDSS